MGWFGRKKTEPSAKPPRTPEEERDETIARVHRLLTDEDVQNRALPQALQDEIRLSPAVDLVPGGGGEFGRASTNPIPVNGPIGAAIYLSSLVTGEGQPVAFQRIGAINSKVDLYETVAFDGARWDCLYLTTIFPRKSRIAPAGFRFAGEDEKSILIRGMADNAEDFPRSIYPLVMRFTQRIVGVPVADPRLKAFDTIPIRLPESHNALLQQLRFGGGVSPQS